MTTGVSRCMFKLKNVMSKLFAHYKPKSPIAESFRTLRTNISFSALEHPIKTLLITSPGPEDGKSTVTANLGVVMAQAGTRVLIIDADLRKPVMHKFFETTNRVGLTRLLAHEVQSGDVVYPTPVEGLSFMPTGPIPPNPSELLGSERMKIVLKDLAGQYDLVIIDSPPVLAVTDASILAPMADGVILVLNSGQTRVDASKDARAQLEKANARIIGVVLNKVKMDADDYSYYYYYRREEDQKDGAEEKDS